MVHIAYAPRSRLRLLRAAVSLAAIVAACLATPHGAHAQSCEIQRAFPLAGEASPELPMKYELQLEDLNNDGFDDVVFLQAGSTFPERHIVTRLSQGDGTFGPVWISEPISQYPSPYPGRLIALEDFTGDDIPDAIVATRDCPPEIEGETCPLLFPGMGDGSFSAPQIVQPISFDVGWFIADDFNADGLADVLMGGQVHSFLYDARVLLGQGDGTFVPAAQISISPTNWLALAVGHFNDDAFPDLVFPNLGNAYHTLIRCGDGQGSFGPPEMVTDEYSGDLVAAELIDGGGGSILMYGQNRSAVAYVRRPGGMLTFAGETPYPAGFHHSAGSLSLRDVDLDGHLDFIVPGDRTILARGVGDGQFGIPTTVIQIPTEEIAIGDVNNDCYPDIVAMHESLPTHSPSPVAYLGLGDGTFRGPREFGGSRPAGVAWAGDLDLNGIDDLIMASRSSSSNPEPTRVVMHDRFGPGRRRTAPTIDDVIDMDLGDFNGNGYPDAIFIKQ